MSSISLNKFGENLPVTSIAAFSQAAVGFGAGLLIASRLGHTARNRTAIALIGAGAATIIPFIAGIVANIRNRPTSSRRSRQTLASIREDTGISNGSDAY
jgi:gas vesicle protein